MYVEDDKLWYTWEDYNEDIKHIDKLIDYNISGDYSIVSIYRGSLGIGAHLSNLKDAPLSVLQYQTRDGNDKTPSMVIDTIKDGDSIVVVDDICDSGKTIKDVTNYLLKNYPNSYILNITIFGSSSNTLYCREHNGEWINFPWEYTK